MMILTDWQKKEFATLGFLILPQLFSPEEIVKIEAEYEVGRVQMTTLGLRPVGLRGQLNWSNLRRNAPTLGGLPEDERLAGVAEQLFGPEAFMVHCNSNQFVGAETEWHRDAKFTEFRGLKFALYLQPLRANNGALRVIPGSHLPCFSTALDQLRLAGVNIGDDHSYLHLSGKTVGDFPCYVCATDPGDMIVFDLRLWHASWGGGNRGLVSSDFHAYPASVEEHKSEVTFRDLHRGSMQTYRSPQPQYGPEWLRNIGGSARRARWINTLDEFGYLHPLDTGLRYDSPVGGADS